MMRLVMFKQKRVSTFMLAVKNGRRSVDKVLKLGVQVLDSERRQIMVVAAFRNYLDKLEAMPLEEFDSLVMEQDDG